MLQWQYWEGSIKPVLHQIHGTKNHPILDPLWNVTRSIVASAFNVAMGSIPASSSGIEPGKELADKSTNTSCTYQVLSEYSQ